MSDLRDLYEEVILDHNRNPRNFLKKPEGTNHQAYGFNPLCGDEFTVYLVVEDGTVKDVGFEGAGCAISTASASLMTEAVRGKSIEEAQALFQGVRNLLTQQGDVPDLGKLAVLSGVHAYPSRVKCATLAWHTLQAALENRQDEMVTTE
ncbi:MAG: Fe-S cluster assembly sulfur transfer protein SufU [Acidiferrobacterales bacterium]